ncbi:MAG TPA: hypothetical protein GXX25_02050 [Desulfotomaculum sp.]|nr:hypothetical protein [Desulfotomaculum sp.]
MFFRKIISRSGGKEYAYLKLIENYREGSKVKQRVIANLGNMENLTPEKVENLIEGLARVCGISRRPARVEARRILRYGEVLVLHHLWRILDIPGALDGITGGKKGGGELSLLLELMTINQVIKPPNKQVISDWCRCLYLPDLEGKELLEQHFYRALEQVAEIKDTLAGALFHRLSALIPVDTGITYAWQVNAVLEAAPAGPPNLSFYSRYLLEEPAVEKNVQFLLLVSGNGMPLDHYLLPEVAGEGFWRAVTNRIHEGYGARRVIFAGDRRVPTNPYLEVPVALGLPYLIRRSVEEIWNGRVDQEEPGPATGFVQVDQDLWFKEMGADGIRRLICYSPQAAREKIASFREHLSALEGQLQELQRKGGLSAEAPVLRDDLCREFFNWHVDRSTGEFRYRRREDRIAREEKCAGMLVLETNVPEVGGAELVRAYLDMKLLGRGCREIRSFEHRPRQYYQELSLTGNLVVCVLALLLERVMERLLAGAGLKLTARQALALLEEVQMAINRVDGVEMKSVTPLQRIHQEILRVLGINNLQQEIG